MTSSPADEGFGSARLDPPDDVIAGSRRTWRLTYTAGNHAIRPGGTGQLQKEQLIWQRTAGIPHVPSPLLVGKEMFVINDDGAGVARCLDAMTGDEIWRARLDGNYRASPIEIRGRIYFSNDKGQTFVVTAAKEYKLLATNELDGFFYASPAVAGKALFLRSETHLYRIES